MSFSWAQKIARRFKKLNPIEDIVLWAIISLFVLPSAGIAIGKWFGLWYGFCAAVLLALVIVIGRFYNMQAKFFVTVVTVFFTGAALLFQSRALTVQTQSLSVQSDVLKVNLKQMQLNTRPQVAVTIYPRGWNRDNTSYFGGNIEFENYSAFSARNMKTEYLISNDTGKADDFKKWYSDTYGSFPEISFVSAKSKSDQIPLVPSIPRAANFACIGVKVLYQGFDSNKKYWHIIRKTYRLAKDKDGNLTDLILIDNVQQSDDDSGADVPRLEVPIWKKFALGILP